MSHFIYQILGNYALWIALCAWLTAQVIKIIIELLRKRRLNWGLLMSSGGMPSSHSSFVTAVTTVIGLTEGFDSPIFALGAIVSLIVMYDASGVRRAAGNQAKVINDILASIENSGFEFEKKLKEMLGHTPIEVAAGGVLGIIVALSLY
ncbi:MAG: divergent PAP2 family protein [Clostridiales bacterium]|jgi:acid phosphatase family membrane protein YuiD|nr:divergent PAP2 family protein [Clostridiales bacterium]